MNMFNSCLKSVAYLAGNSIPAPHQVHRLNGLSHLSGRNGGHKKAVVTATFTYSNSDLSRPLNFGIKQGPRQGYDKCQPQTIRTYTFTTPPHEVSIFARAKFDRILETPCHGTCHAIVTGGIKCIKQH